jgi:hypothetical protein
VNDDVPALVTALTFMPPGAVFGREVGALDLTSWTMSLFIDTIMPQLQPMSRRLDPSSCAVLPDDRMPLTV